MLFDGFQHGAIGGLLARHGAHLGRLKLAVEAQGDKDVVGSHQPIHPLVDLVTAEGMIEATLQTGAKMGHHREGGLLIGAGGPGRAIGAQLVDLALEGDQLAIEVVKGTETKVAVAQQLAHGGLPFVDPRQQGAHQRALVNLAAIVLPAPAGKLLAHFEGTRASGTVRCCNTFHSGFTSGLNPVSVRIQW